MHVSFTFNYGIERPVYEPPANPCVPSPCGPFSQCRVVGHTSACSCLANYIGRPPQCRPECTINSECPANLACINERCRDPCVGSCGISAICNVVNHSPVCTCQYLYTGDPFSGCHPVPSKNLFIQSKSRSFLLPSPENLLFRIDDMLFSYQQLKFYRNI